VDRALADAVAAADPGCPLLPIERRMLPPWLLEKKADHADWIRKHG
jgi:hypothetical protein